MDNKEKIEDLLTKDTEKTKEDEQEKGCDLCNCFCCYTCNIDISHLFSICCICLYIE